jgi:phytol kinase
MVILTPFVISSFIKHEKSNHISLTFLFIAIIISILFSKKMREKSQFIETMFTSFDRPEDRPNTLKWFVSQYVVANIVLIPISYYFIYVGKEALILIPILINGIGDGLAEPVGITFGKHAYKTRALFSKKEYKRTLEGSFMVFLSALIILLFFNTHFTMVQLIVCCVLIPPIVTLTEAKAPHTWDTPFIFLSSGLSMIIITSLI